MIQDDIEKMRVHLKEFVAQRDNGTLSQEEFAAQKKILLWAVARQEAAILKTFTKLLKNGKITQEYFDEIKNMYKSFKID